MIIGKFIPAEVWASGGLCYLLFLVWSPGGRRSLSLVPFSSVSKGLELLRYYPHGAQCGPQPGVAVHGPGGRLPGFVQPKEKRLRMIGERTIG